MTKEEMLLREKRMTWSEHILGAHCAFLNFVLDLRKVTGMSDEDAEAELLRWLKQKIPFQETIDAYAYYGRPPETLSDQLSLDA